jgi:ribosomal protein S18 acetylase RimI-like enzyme
MFNIREKKQEDVNALRHLFLQARRKTFTWLNTIQYRLSDFDEQTKEEFILVAVLKDEVVGFISLWLADNFIHHLYVGDRHQHRGIGKALLTTAVETMKLPIKLKCLQKNIQAIDFYKSQGFYESGTGVADEGLYTVLQLSNIREEATANASDLMLTGAN